MSYRQSVLISKPELYLPEWSYIKEEHPALELEVVVLNINKESLKIF